MTRARFRTRLFLILSLFAIVPAAALTMMWGGVLSTALPLLSGSAPWERVAVSGERALNALRDAPLTPEQRAAVAAHERELRASVTEARRWQFLATRAAPLVGGVSLVALLIVAVVASRVAGHLSRQLSRPLDELVGWTGRIARQLPLPSGPPLRGAPEFEVLRERMRTMAGDLETGRARALEAERLRAFRETARRIAHELKNPSPELAETIEVLAIESARLETMAKSFSQFGHLPEGPPADVDIGELTRYAARSTVPPQIPLALEIDDALPLVRGHHDALARAVSNILLNAVDACAAGGTIAVRVVYVNGDGPPAVRIAVRDTGCGIAPDQLARIWEPYVTQKPGGTGLGLAITRQTVLAHHGTVDATSAPGAGTEIALTLPVNPDDA
jgi:signal transduction histidine kinase